MTTKTVCEIIVVDTQLYNVCTCILFIYKKSWQRENWTSNAVHLRSIFLYVQFQIVFFSKLS